MRSIRFIHISDTHIVSSEGGKLYDVMPNTCAKKIVDMINNLNEPIDFIVHTGDVTATKPFKEEYIQAQKILNMLRYPAYYVTGNHDRSSFIAQYLSQGERELLVEDSSKNAYFFDKKGYRFIVFDGRGPDEIDPSGTLSEDQFEALEKEIATGRQPLLVFIHYPPVRLDSSWLDKNMLLLEGDRLHSIFQKAKNRLAGVFFGHIHRGIQMVKDGVFYSSVGSTFMQFQSFPSQKEPIFESTGQAYFNYVTIENGEIMIKEYSVPNGAPTFIKTKRDFHVAL